MWLRPKYSEEYHARTFCKHDGQLETMKYILTNCETPGQKEVWEAKHLVIVILPTGGPDKEHVGVPYYVHGIDVTTLRTQANHSRCDIRNLTDQFTYVLLIKTSQNWIEGDIRKYEVIEKRAHLAITVAGPTAWSIAVRGRDSESHTQYVRHFLGLIGLDDL